jgi:hypothetical protein
MAKNKPEVSIPTDEELKASANATRGNRVVELYAMLSSDLYFKVAQMPSVARYFRIKGGQPGAERCTQVLLSAVQNGWAVDVYYSRNGSDIGDVVHLFATSQ